MHNPHGKADGHGVTRMCAAIGVAIALTTGVRAAAQTARPALEQLSLEDLMNVEVTSVSRRAERLSDTAASVYVLTNDDLRRSGASTIPDALRMVPGLHVGQIDANGWSVSVRGFGGRFANKLLVLVDGQSVYSPLFSGVFWDLVNVPMEDIERIEVIRGPGATLWGANAVNGVINIITRSASSSQGGAVTAETGTASPAGGSLRYGGHLNANVAYRVDVNGFSRGGTRIMSHGDATESWEGGRVGARLDAQVGPRSRLTVMGGSVRTRADELWTVPQLQTPYQRQAADLSRHVSSTVMGRWGHTTDRGETTLQALVNQSFIHEFVLDERRRTIDIDAQQTRQVGGAHRLIWGGSYRNSTDRTEGTPLIRLAPDDRTLQFLGGFAQDEVAMHDGAVRLTLGTKLEHNDFTGWEVQPSARARVALPKHQSVWTSASRAVRLPSRAEADGIIEPAVLPPSAQAPLPQLLSLRHGERVDAEVLLAYEVGYRAQPREALSIDASLFLNDYHHLLTNLIGAPRVAFAPAPHLVVPVVFDSRGTARGTGGEVTADWRVTPQLRVQGGYSRFDRRENRLAPIGPALAPLGDYPGHQVHARGAFSLPRQVEVETMARFVSAREQAGVPSYVTVDARVGMRLGSATVSLIGRNLAQPDHGEYLPDVLFTARTAVRRSVGLRVRWQS